MRASQAGGRVCAVMSKPHSDNSGPPPSGTGHGPRDWPDAIERARRNAPFLQRLLDNHADLADLLREGQGEKALAEAKQAGSRSPDTGVSLRRERNAVSLVLAIGDLAGGFSLERVMRELTDLADRALDRAMRSAIARRVPDFEQGDALHGFTALALGKQGAGELNYSSDIDPILLFDPETLPRRARDEPAEAAQRYARDVIKTLSENTAEGYVFRVDLRLRPASEVSPLAVSFDAATTHYESLALTWERAAFIRARAAAGDIPAGEAFLSAISPFVWRRSLDFGAIDEVRALSERIRDRYDGPRLPGPDFDLKQGPGGIREIEFFAQTHQLIHGGRDVSLRQRGTRAALNALAAADRILPETAAMMGDAYDRLRVAEHRVQMRHDRQTHRLPDGDELEALAGLDGKTSASLVADLSALCAPVRETYGALIDTGAASGDVDGDMGKDMGAEMGRESRGVQEMATPFAARVKSWSDGRYRALKSAAALSAFDKVQPELLRAIAAAPDPNLALSRWENLLARLPNAINFFHLLEARPALLELLLNCLTAAAPLADELARRPELLDALIDNSAFDLPPSVAALKRLMGQGARMDDYERQLDRIRIVTGEQRFAMGMQLVEAAQDPLDVAAGLSRVAEAGLHRALEAAEAEFARQHGQIEGSSILVLGLGRLGGGALTHASDLDLVFLFEDGAKGGESDGARPLSQTLYFNRLAQRISAAMSVPTAEGALYEIDTRLRPQGMQGPLAVGLSAFAKYQHEDAWTWEHMALTRARVLAGSKRGQAALEEIIQKVLRRPREPEKLRSGVLSMRDEMARHKPAQGPLDVKLLRGGLVDLEFLVHFLQLRDGTGLTPDLPGALRALVEAGQVPDELAAAYMLMSRVLIAARLLAPDAAMPAPQPAHILARLARQGDADCLLQALAKARQSVARHWLEIFEQKLELD